MDTHIVERVESVRVLFLCLHVHVSVYILCMCMCSCVYDVLYTCVLSAHVSLVIKYPRMYQIDTKSRLLPENLCEHVCACACVLMYTACSVRAVCVFIRNSVTEDDIQRASKLTYDSSINRYFVCVCIQYVYAFTRVDAYVPCWCTYVWSQCVCMCVCVSSYVYGVLCTFVLCAHEKSCH